MLVLWGLAHVIFGMTFDHEFAFIHLPFGAALVLVGLFKS